MRQTFSLHGVRGCGPRAALGARLPWAGMSQAVGLRRREGWLVLASQATTFHFYFSAPRGTNAARGDFVHALSRRDDNVIHCVPFIKTSGPRAEAVEVAGL